MSLFGEKLKELRLEEGLTQIQLANDLHLDKSTIAKYETGQIEPSTDILQLVAQYFKTSTDYLLGIKDF